MQCLPSISLRSENHCVIRRFGDVSVSLASKAGGAAVAAGGFAAAAGAAAVGGATIAGQAVVSAGGTGAAGLAHVGGKVVRKVCCRLVKSHQTLARQQNGLLLAVQGQAVTMHDNAEPNAAAPSMAEFIHFVHCTVYDEVL